MSGSTQGRKGKPADVIPFRQEGEKTSEKIDATTSTERQNRIAIELAARLKPRGLPAEVGKVWDVMAPAACHPTKNRVIDPMTAHSFSMVCYEVARFHRLDRYLQRAGETYESETRNGIQFKNRPEVGQRNVAWSNGWRGMLEFGMTPGSAKKVLEEAPPGLFDDEKDDDDDFG